jgi:hypothetical protein
MQKTSGNKMSKGLIKLRDKLDAEFSKYIRLKYADEYGNVTCYTCGQVKFWKEMQCGHYISRRHLCTRWNEDNCRPQDARCNLFNQGNIPVFSQKLLREYGEKKLDELLELSNNTCKFTESEFKELIKHYNKLWKSLEKSLQSPR